MTISIAKPLLIFLLSTLFLFFYKQSDAQLIDSIKIHLQHKPAPYFKLETRNSFINSRKAVFTGLKFGFNYNSRLVLGTGFSFFSSSYWLSRYYNRTLFNQDNLRLFSVSYFTPFLEYNFYNLNRWHFTIPVQFGLGWASIYHNNLNDDAFYSFTRPIFAYEPLMSADYKLSDFFSIGFGFGYRILLLNNKYFGRYFNSPIYMINFNLIWDNITPKVKDVF